MGMSSEEVPEADRVYFTRVMDEAAAQRAHEQKLAEIQAQKEVDIANAKRDNSWTHTEWKKNFVVGILSVLALLVVATGIWFIIDNVQDGRRAERLKTEQMQQETAQQCIEAGNIWINQSCLLANKGGS